MPITTTLSNIVFSAYCACKICCGPDASGITSAGTKPKAGITIAAPRKYPLGTSIMAQMGGKMHTYVIEDRTSKKWDGRRWDIYFEDHKAAQNFGLRTGTVTIVSFPKPPKPTIKK